MRFREIFKSKTNFFIPLLNSIQAHSEISRTIIETWIRVTKERRNELSTGCFSLCLQSNSGGAARLRASFKINRKANGIGEMIQQWRRSRPRSTNLEYPTRFVLLNYFGWTNQTQFHRKSISFHIFLTLCLLHHHWTRKSNFNKIVRASKCTRSHRFSRQN